MRMLLCLAVLVLVIPAAAGFVLAEDQPAEKPAVTPELQKLLNDLGSDDFNVRERASQELAKQGEAARTALEWAAQHEQSLEARWRAQQILRRLEGQKAKPLDGPERPEMEDEDEARRIARELQKRFFGNNQDPFANPFFRNGLALGTVRAPGLALVRDRRGVRLEVIDDTKTGADAKTTYRGQNLDAILAENPELAKHPSMEELKSKMVNPMKKLQELFKGGQVQVFPGQGFSSMFSSSGVEIVQKPDQTIVKIKEKDEDGNEVVKKYTGKDLEEIKKNHPEIKDRLGGMSGMRFEFRPPQIFGRRNAPSPLERRTVTPRPQGPVMGVFVETPEEALAVHLGLSAGHGALVRSVEPGSQAETLGIERNDIIVRVNETPITGVDVLSRMFHAAAQNKSALIVEVIRRGKPLTLSR